MKILVAIPVYDAKLPVEVVRCLLDEQLLAAVGGDEISIRFLPACSHPAMGRNQLAQDFMDSDAERLLFLDADVTFERGALIKLARRSEDFIGGAYRLKLEEERYPVAWLDGPFRGKKLSDDTALLEVAGLPTGFLALSRSVFERMKAAHPERAFEHFGRKMHCHFQMRFEDGQLYGEDIYFCKEWRAAGGVVWLDPELTLTHWNFNRPYVGHIGNWLKGRAVAPTEKSA